MNFEMTRPESSPEEAISSENGNERLVVGLGAVKLSLVTMEIPRIRFRAGNQFRSELLSDSALLI